MSRRRSLLAGACGALAAALVGLWATRSPPPLPGPAPVDVLILGGWEQANPPLDRLAREKHLVLRSVRQTDLEKPESTPDLDRARVVLVLNGPSEQQAAFQERLRRAHEGGRHLVALDGRPWQQSLVASGVIERDDQLARYWRFSGTQNLSHLLDHVAARYLGRGGEAAPPEPSPTSGFYHPDAPEIIGPIEDYRRWYASHLALPEDAPRVAYIVHGSFLLLHETADTDAVIHALERRGMRVFTIFADREQSMREAIAAIAPDLLLTQRHTGLGRPADGSMPIPESVGKPYLKPIGALQTTVEEWRDRPEGLRPGDLAGQVIAQELEGTIEPLVISAQRTAGEYRVQVPLPEAPKPQTPNPKPQTPNPKPL